MGKSYKVIAPDRFLTTSEFKGCVNVMLGEHTVATGTHVILLNEGGRAPVPYLLTSDLTSSSLTPSKTEYRCRWKGDAAYFDLTFGEQAIEDAAWAYPEAPDDLEVLRDRVAFDANTFDIQYVENNDDTAQHSTAQTEAETP